jgi:hypothetical protein
MGDVEFEKRARERLGTDENYKLYSSRIAEFLNAVTAACPVMHELSQISGGVDLNRVSVRRNEGWLVLSATGLVVVGLIGFEILTKNVENWREYAKRLGELDWRRSNPEWHGILVTGEKDKEKIITSQSSVKAAVTKIRELIGWSPELGLPSTGIENAPAEALEVVV